MNISEIKVIIESSLPGAIAEVASPDGVHFTASVVSDTFSTKTKVQQQQLVYAALAPHFASGELHALSLKTYTPDGWVKRTA